MLRVDDAGSPIAALISGLDIAYDLGEGHPLLGRRMPNLDVIAEEKPVRVFGLAHFCCNPTVHQSIPGIVLNASTSCGRVTTPLGDCRCSVRGTPSAVLVRPDGHVAWMGEGSTDGLDAALAKWCGTAAGRAGTVA